MQFERGEQEEEASGVTSQSALILTPISGSPTQLSSEEQSEFLTVIC